MSLPAESTGIEFANGDHKVLHSTSELAGEDSAPTVKSPPQQVRGSALTSSPVRAVAGGLILLLCGLGAMVAVYFGTSASALLRLGGVLSLLSLGCLAFELAYVIKAGDEVRSPLTFIPLAGAGLVSLAGVLPAFEPRLSGSVWLISLVAGPSIATGVLLVVRGLVSRIWDEADSKRSLVSGFSDSGKVVAEGETFRISEDLIVPTDGRVLAGCCCVLERYLSPEARFRVKEEGDIVFAGSSVLSGAAELQALSGSFESCLRRLELAVLPGLRWVEESIRRDHETYVQALAYVLLFCGVTSAIFWDERGATASTILLASGSVMLAGVLGQVGEALYAMRSRLVRCWAERGFLINSARAWSELSVVRSIVFDPARVSADTACFVRELTLLDDRVSKEALCSCVGMLVGRAEDHILSTIGDYCHRSVSSIPADRVVNLREYPGRGICGSVRGVEFSIGSEDFLVERGILIQPSEMVLDDESGERVVLVAIGEDVVARLWIAFGQLDSLSEDAISKWPKGVEGHMVESADRELGSASLLVRGDESNEIGRTHSPEVVLFRPEMSEVPASSVVALTPRIDSLPKLVNDCRRHVRGVLRARAWVLFATFVSVCLIFTGVVSPLIPVLSAPLIALAIFL